MKISNSDLTTKARGIARTLSYNEDAPQAEAKQMLLELSHRLDSLDIRVSKKKDGFLISNGLGKSRFLTFRETLTYKLSGALPKRIHSPTSDGDSSTIRGN